MRMIRRFGEPVVAGQKYGLRPGAYAVLALGRDVLLTYQEDPEPEFQLPGGGIDAGESPIRALHREVLEETGWAIAGLRRLGAFRRFAYMPEYERWAEKLCHIYIARPVCRRGPPSEPGHSAVWMPVETAVRAIANAGDRHFMARAFGLV
jgi:8-oxo-dGTP diphosphatase